MKHEMQKIVAFFSSEFQRTSTSTVRVTWWPVLSEMVNGMFSVFIIKLILFYNVCCTA